MTKRRLMKQLLVPTDFSKCAGNAVDFAAQTAAIFPGKLTLLHATGISPGLYTDYVGLNREFSQTLLNEAKDRLNDIRERIVKEHQIAVDIIASTDPLQEAIKNSVAEKQIDLIVMGTQGAGGIKEKLWGSRTSATIGRAGIPVMAIPMDYTWKKPEKILLVTNRFERDPAILNAVFELAGLYMANMEIAVFTDKTGAKAVTLLNNERNLSSYKKFLKKTYQEETLTTAHLYGHRFEETIQNFIKENGTDLLIMVTYGHKFWNNIFSPSKTKKMSYQTRIPLLAIPVRENEK